MICHMVRRLRGSSPVVGSSRKITAGSPTKVMARSSLRRIPGGHIQLQFAEPNALRAAAAMIPNATPDDDQLILQIPGDGSIASLRRLLNELDDTSIDVEHLSIHSPDLDDVFFAVTGHATTEPATGQEEKVLQS